MTEEKTKEIHTFVKETLQNPQNAVVASLTESETAVLARRFGLLDGEPQTLAQIGEALGITRERARQIEVLALRKLASLKNENKNEKGNAAMTLINIFRNVLITRGEKTFTKDEIKSLLMEFEEWGGKAHNFNNYFRFAVLHHYIKEVAPGMYQVDTVPMPNMKREKKKANLNPELLAPLTDAESQAVEAEIQNDRKYRQRAEEVFKTHFGELGSYERIFTTEGEHADFYQSLDYENIVHLVKQIAVDNKIQGKSTVQIILLSNYITYPENRFFERLFVGDLKLVEDFCDFVGRFGKRREQSLCSKICKYFSLFFFGRDHYFIYDSVVRSYLNPYRRKYGLPDADLSYYAPYAMALSELRDVACPTLSKTEMDHVIWYRNK